MRSGHRVRRVLRGMLRLVFSIQGIRSSESDMTEIFIHAALGPKLLFDLLYPSFRFGSQLLKLSV
jgi:hypothetical protein